MRSKVPVRGAREKLVIRWPDNVIEYCRFPVESLAVVIIPRQSQNEPVLQPDPKACSTNPLLPGRPSKQHVEATNDLASTLDFGATVFWRCCWSANIPKSALVKHDSQCGIKYRVVHGDEVPSYRDPGEHSPKQCCDRCSVQKQKKRPSPKRFSAGDQNQCHREQT